MRTPDHFVQFVRECLSRLERIGCFEQNGPVPQLTWPEMAESDWRDSALVSMNRQYVAEAKFVEPTAEYPNWVFLARRKGRTH